MTKTSTNRYKVTIKLKTGGGTGTVTGSRSSGPTRTAQRQWTRQRVPDPLADPADAAGDLTGS